MKLSLFKIGTAAVVLAWAGVACTKKDASPTAASQVGAPTKAATASLPTTESTRAEGELPPK